MLIKLILLALGAWVVYRLVQSYGRRIRQEDTTKPETGEDMVRCAHCGVHLPRSESIVSHGESFCTNEHRQLHQK
ncbi:PP0621 family protein [Sulfuricella denitrificans]|uniref:PP0621 family protein n=1 Tax=Sulfuricella denitrificans TaxID=649841 RepID=UPI0002F7D175|nr:PP0621 family protein [Sulfuricella denitrificans]